MGAEQNSPINQHLVNVTGLDYYLPIASSLMNQVRRTRTWAGWGSGSQALADNTV
jgi:hypothetical protein